MALCNKTNNTVVIELLRYINYVVKAFEEVFGFNYTPLR